MIYHYSQHGYFRCYNPSAQIESLVISNKEMLAAGEPKPEPEYTMAGWYRGYSFKHFWSNCNAFLGQLSNLDGVQQLCHHYYLQNGSLGAAITADRIKRLIGTSTESMP